MSDSSSLDHSALPKPPAAEDAARLEKPPIRTRRRSIPRLRESVTPPKSGWAFRAPEPAHYVVPRTFGMSAILGIITALAVLFGGFHFYDAHPLLYLFFGVQAIMICLAQMLYGKTPRAASAIAGALLLPAFLAAFFGLFGTRRNTEGALCLMMISVPTGAFFGYITGTMAAGVFLVMDSFERLYTTRRQGVQR